EAAVAIEQRRIAAVKFDALLVRNEHGHLGAVGAGVEDLLDLEIFGIEADLRLVEEFAEPGQEVEAIRADRDVEAVKRVEDFRIRSIPLKAAPRADPRQVHLAE